VTTLERLARAVHLAEQVAGDLGAAPLSWERLVDASRPLLPLVTAAETGQKVLAGVQEGGRARARQRPRHDRAIIALAGEMGGSTRSKALRIARKLDEDPERVRNVLRAHSKKVGR
jgi:hypothetical protein